MGTFRIKIAASWFSQDYIVLKYSTNGIFWKTVKEYKYDCMDEWCYMSTMICGFKNAKGLLENFKTLEDVMKHEAEQKQKVRKHNNEIAERNRKHKKERDDVYRQFS